MALVYTPETGEIVEVKNLGWLIKHRWEVRLICITPGRDEGDTGAAFRAHLADGRHYITRFASERICKDFCNARRFPLAEVEIHASL